MADKNKIKEEVQKNLMEADGFLKSAMSYLENGDIEKSYQHFNIVSGKFVNLLKAFEDEK